MAVKRAYGTPGGYIGREKVRKYNAFLLGYFAYGLVSAVLIWTFFADAPYSTLIWIALAVAPLATPIARRSLSTWLGPLSGSHEVGRQLEPLTHAGYDVVRDVDLGRGSVDHVVFGPSGIYAIEIKAIGGATRTARKRAVASAALVRNRLAMCGLDAYVIAVVALARTTLPHGPMSLRHAYVVDGRSLATWIARRTARLGTLEIERARSALTPYVTT